MPKKKVRRPAACWKRHESGRMELLRVPRPVGGSVVAAMLTAHVGGLLVPSAPVHVLGLVGFLVSLIVRSHGGALILTCANAILVPAIVHFSASGAKAIDQVDHKAFATVAAITILIGAQEVIHHTYRRISWHLLLPVFWVSSGPTKS